jgi:tRNA (guanine-N7-)-methyltransferase
MTDSVATSKSTIIPVVSILERIDPVVIFDTPQPLEVELGSGDGSFLVNYARIHPERNFLGIERLLGRLRKLDRKARRAGLRNLAGMRIESAYFLEFMLPRGSVSAVHVYFPDPWPKRKHRKNRLINSRFAELAYACLMKSGVVFLRTDDGDYFAQMTEVFGASKQFAPVETPEELGAVVTDFERNFNLRGIITRRAAYRKVDNEGSV